MVGKSFISSNGFRLAAIAANPVVSTAEVRRKLRRPMASWPAALECWLERTVVCPYYFWRAVRSGRGADLPQWMRTGRRLARGKGGVMRIVAVHADLSFNVPGQFQRKSVFEQQAVETAQAGVPMAMLHQVGGFRTQHNAVEPLILVNAPFPDDLVEDLHHRDFDLIGAWPRFREVRQHGLVLI